MRKTIFVLAIGAALAACAGGSAVPDRPFARFEPDQRWVNSDTRPAFILEIDGETQSIERSSAVAPGPHKLVVSVPSGNNVGMGYGSSRRETITIDAKPCVAYYLAARRPPEGGREWNAFIAGTETIRGCRASSSSSSRP